MMRMTVSLVTAIAASALSLAAQRADVGDVHRWMGRVGERVEAYFVRAQSVVCKETVRLEPLGIDLLPNGDHVRQLVYELRVSWGPNGSPDADASQTATVLRQLLTVDGRAPRPNEEPGCFDREPVSPEPLVMFLPQHQRDYVFSWKGTRREGGRDSVELEYRSMHAGTPVATWRGDCLSVELPGRTRGRVSVDAATADVLRLDEELVGQVDVPVPEKRPRMRGAPSRFTIERADSTVAYRPVTFRDPDETILLPASVVSLQITPNAGTPRLRTYQTFSNYRRFLTGARIIE